MKAQVPGVMPHDDRFAVAAATRHVFRSDANIGLAVEQRHWAKQGLIGPQGQLLRFRRHFR